MHASRFNTALGGRCNDLVDLRTGQQAEFQKFRYDGLHCRTPFPNECPGP
jgi:hypothetical protein